MYYCRILFCLMILCMPSLQAQDKGGSSVSLEETVLGLSADNVEDREASYQKILKNPKAYLQLLAVAAKDEDPELSTKALELLYFAQLGIDAATRPELVNAAVLLRGLDQEGSAKLMRELFIRYTDKRDLSLSEYFMLTNLEQEYPVSSRNLRDRFIMAQASQAFTLALETGKDPFIYMLNCLVPPTHG